MLRYLLEVETRGSQSLLNIDAFADPTAYSLEVKKPGTDEYATRAVDLVETFNYLIGLRVMLTSVPQTLQATFKRMTDPELPEDQHTKLVVDGCIRQDADGPWWFRKVEGWVPKDPANPNNGQGGKCSYRLAQAHQQHRAGQLDAGRMVSEEPDQHSRIRV